MIKYSAKQYNEILYKLPQEIRETVINLDTTHALWKIGEKHKLHIDMVGVMHDMAMDVMMGIIASKDFVKGLQNELGVPAFDASAIARDIDEEIFKPIKETMVKLYAEGAPNKPSSSLVQFYEEEESHPSLDKETLLKEIENPAPVVVKVEQKIGAEVKPILGLETKEEVEDLAQMRTRVSPTLQKPEIKVGAAKPSAPSSQPSNALPSSISSSLEKLASMKLSGSFVMPKEGGINPVALSTPPKPKMEEEKKLTASNTPPVIVAKPDATPYTPPNAKYPVDPYREPTS